MVQTTAIVSELRDLSDQQNDRSSINVLEQISELSRQFRRRIARGDTPKIERFLGKVAESGRENLFTNLLDIEISYRRSQGDSPTSAEYLKRFSAYTRIVRRAFFEPTIASDSEGEADGATFSRTEPEADDKGYAPTQEIPTSTLGNYELIRQLGQGGMGVVYEARHTKTDNRVALKTLRTHFDGQPIDANKLYRFRKEFRSLSEVNHPNLVGMQTLEVDGDRWFFTMDLIEGEDFISYVRPKDQLDEDRLRACLPQLAKGIIALHQHGIVHRDLKPGNIMVTEDCDVQILDFGLVAELQQKPDAPQTRTGMFVGTIPYAAPEQMFGQRTEANDWYGFGTIIYEALTGTLPFPGNKQDNLLRKQQENPPRLAGQDGMPIDLAELVDGLLRREASTRLGADAVAQFFQLDNDTRIQSSIQGLRGSSGSAGSVDEEHLDSDAFVEEEIVLIGREKQLAQLEEARQQVLAEQKPQVVWITGLSGEGKSSLVEKFLQPLRKNTEMLVLSGRCHDRETVPFKVIDCTIDPLVSFLNSRAPSDLDESISSDTELLLRIFPSLRRVKLLVKHPEQDIGGADSRQLQHRAFLALKNLWAGIARHTPIVIFIDDLQWGDAQSAEVIQEAISGPSPTPVLLIGAFRSDEVERSAFLKRWNEPTAQRSAETPIRQITVGSLDAAMCRDLLDHRFDGTAPLSSEDADLLVQESGGNPYLLELLAEALRAGEEVTRKTGLQKIVEGRLKRLPPEASMILHALSVAGKSCQVIEIARAADLEEQTLALLIRMRTEKLVRFTAADDQLRVDSYHHKLRETVLQSLQRDQMQELHRKLGQVIESEEQINFEQLYRDVAEADHESTVHSHRIFELASHFEQCDDADRAVVYALLAAQSARQRFDLDVAIDLLVAAKRLCEELDARLIYAMDASLGETLLLAGRYREAESVLDNAERLAKTDRQRLRVAIKQAELAYYSSSLSETRDCFDRLLKKVGVWLPTSPTAIRIFLRYHHFRWRLTHYRQRSGVTNARAASWTTARISEILAAGVPALYHSNPARGVLACYIVLSRTHGQRDTITSARQNAHLSQGCASILGDEAAARNHYRIALQVAEKVNDESLKALAAFYFAWGLSLVGRLQESLELWDELLREHGQSMDAWRSTFARINRARVTARLGRVEECVEDCCEFFQKANTAGQATQAVAALESWAYVSDGNFPFQELRESLEGDVDAPYHQVRLLTCECRWHLFHARTDLAVRRSEAAERLLRNQHLMDGMLSFAVSAHATALRCHGEFLARTDPKKGRKMIRRSVRVARRAIRLSKSYRSDLPYALLELAKGLAADGRISAGYRYARASESEAEAQGAEIQARAARLCRIQLLGQLGRQLKADEDELRRLKEFERDYQNRVTAASDSTRARGR